MPSTDLPIPLVVIVGPTAVGKTDFAIRLAGELAGEIISADSRLFYRGMDIGTAKPSLEDRQRIPHHLIDVADPDEVWSLAQFQHAAQQAIIEVHQRGRLPLLVGGTGQYVRAVIEGWSPPAQKPDVLLREALCRWADEIGVFALHQRLARLDPLAAAAIDPRNVRRTVRALEVILRSGQRFSTLRQRVASPYRLLMLGLTRPRPELYARIDARLDSMLAQGFLEEVRDLLKKGYSPNLPSFSAIGYAELIGVIEGQLTLAEAVTLIRRKSRQFVRRQANWFKADDPGIHWFAMQPDPLPTVIELVREFLGQ